jgi:hypothetical protein
MSAPQVYRAISAVAGVLASAPLPKRHYNQRDDYLYRSIDDLLDRLSPLLAKHKLCILPRVLERTACDRQGDADQLLVSVTLKVAFDLVCTIDGSSHTVEAFGEALDTGDKATSKAMSSAYKTVMLQCFCVPLSLVDDTDALSTRLKRTHHPKPDEGWDQWAAGVTDIVSTCATNEALERIRDRQRSLLNALSRERPDLYAAIGTAFADCSSALQKAAPTISRADKRRTSAAAPKARSAAAAPAISSGQGRKKSTSRSGRRAADQRPMDQQTSEVPA